MSVRPVAARVPGARVSAGARASARPAGRAGSAPRSTTGSRPAPGSSPSSRPSSGDGSGGNGWSFGRRRGGGDEPRQITLRSALFAVVLLVAFIVLAPTLRAYVGQQEQLRDVNTSLAETQAQAEALQGELDRWDDPEYVKSQARERFGFVAPGETPYRVIDPETITGEDPMADLAQEAAARSPYVAGTVHTGPWYTTIWGSVEVAGAAQHAGDE